MTSTLIYTFLALALNTVLKTILMLVLLAIWEPLGGLQPTLLELRSVPSVTSWRLPCSLSVESNRDVGLA